MKQWVSKKFLNIPEGNGCICICRSHTHGINDALFLLGKILNNLVWKYQNKQTFKMSSSNSFDFFKRSNIFSMATTVRTWRSCEKKCQTDAPKKSFQSRCYIKMVPYWYTEQWCQNSYRWDSLFHTHQDSHFHDFSPVLVNSAKPPAW